MAKPSPAARGREVPEEEPRERIRAVYAAEFAYVLRTVRRLGVAAADAPDVVHDVFVVVFRRWDEYDPARPIRAWLFGIAYRIVGNHLGRSFRHAEVSLDKAPDRAPDPVVPEQDAARDVLLRALEFVDVPHRAVLILHDIEERPAPEIADILGIPLNTVYSRLRVARVRVTAAARRLLARGER